MTEIKHTSGWRLGDRVEIVCYTNTRGTAERSLFLSKKRAESIVQYLVKNFGLPRDKLEPLGCGNSVPVCVGDGEECRRANNRVEILWKRGL
jgi:OOP family OmpA-OmpF porin